MEYNNYYPTQAGHPPPPIPNTQPHPPTPQQQPPPPPPPQQHGFSPMPMMPGNGMMHNSITPQPPMGPVATPPGPPPGHPQMQQQPPPHHMQAMPSPGPHPNYHQLPPHPPLPPHSASPHTPQSINHQTNMNLQPPSRPSTGPSPHHHQPSPHHHQPSPHHMGGPPPMHAQQHHGPPPPHHQPSPHQMNHQMNVPAPGGPPPPGMMPHGGPSHQGPGPGLMHPQLPNQNCISGINNMGGPNYPQHQHSHPHYHPPPPPTIHHPPMHHAQPPPPTYVPAHMQPIERNSPFYQNIPQTEFRIMEFNKRLQNRPRTRTTSSPLPILGSYEDSFWWDRFVSDFFDDDATLTIRLQFDDKPTDYSIGRTLIPRFFKSYFEGGVLDLSIKLRNTREITHPHMISLECDQTDITTKNIFKPQNTNIFMNAVVHTEGRLILDFVNSFDALLIKSWRFHTQQCHEYIDRSVTGTGLPHSYLVEPVTRHGLTKQTFNYLKMCMIVEPMQDLMALQRRTNLDPRQCLKQLLVDKYKLKGIEDNRAQPKRRKRRAPANTATGGNTKKSKANANANANANSINAMAVNNNNNVGFNNMNSSSLMSPSNIGGVPNLPALASQDVMVVGEPSMLGADFGDENERRITRLENNQFDASLNPNISQNQNQLCNNNNPSMGQSNNMNHIHQQQAQLSHPQTPTNSQQSQQANNHETGGGNMQMINHNSVNVGNNPNQSDNSTGSDSINNGMNNGNCLPSNSNNGNSSTSNNKNDNSHQMNLMGMNGGLNHLGHMVKSESDLKHSPQMTSASSAPATTGS